jgi:hypothetical protein
MTPGDGVPEEKPPESALPLQPTPPLPGAPLPGASVPGVPAPEAPVPGMPASPSPASPAPVSESGKGRLGSKARISARNTIRCRHCAQRVPVTAMECPFCRKPLGATAFAQKSVLIPIASVLSGIAVALYFVIPLIVRNLLWGSSGSLQETGEALSRHPALAKLPTLVFGVLGVLLAQMGSRAVGGDPRRGARIATGALVVGGIGILLWLNTLLSG